MEIKVLVENNSGEICYGEKGLSLLIKSDNKKILFDVGASSLFQENADKLGVNLEDVDCIVLSHGHWDHGDGLKFIKKKKLICHPESFIKRYRKKDNSYLGLPFSLKEAQKRFDLITVKNPYKISENIIFLGEIPRENDFEGKKTAFRLENGQEDFIMDDSAIAVISKKGLIVIPGCSHAGICNILEYAKTVSGIYKIYAVIGGLHLLELDSNTYKTINFLEKENIKIFYPIHCTSQLVADEIAKKLDGVSVRKTFSGDTIIL